MENIISDVGTVLTAMFGTWFTSILQIFTSNDIMRLMIGLGVGGSLAVLAVNLISRMRSAA